MPFISKCGEHSITQSLMLTIATGQHLLNFAKGYVATRLLYNGKFLIWRFGGLGKKPPILDPVAQNQVRYALYQYFKKETCTY